MRRCVRRVQSVVARGTVRQDDNCSHLDILVVDSLEGNFHASQIYLWVVKPLAWQEEASVAFCMVIDLPLQVAAILFDQQVT